MGGAETRTISDVVDHQAPPARGWLGFATGRRTAWILALLPILIGMTLIGALGPGERDRLPTDQLPVGFDSTRAVELAQQLPDTDSKIAVILFSAEQGTLTPAHLEMLESVIGSLSGQQPVLVPSEDGTAALTILPVEATSATEVAEAVGELRTELINDAPPGVTAQVTGPAGIEADLAAVFDGANVRLLAVTALVVAVLLIITYRSPVLWILPLFVIGMADQTAAVLATRVLATLDVPWDESTIGILSVLVFGAGTNYALLLISRYRDELRGTSDRRAAMRTALPRTAEPVLCSAATVVAGLLTLLLSLVPTTRGLGLACAVGIVVAATFVLVCLPSLLVLFPRAIFWPKVPQPGDTSAAEAQSVWRRVGDNVAKRPVAVGAVVVVGLGILALGNLSIRLGLDTADQFLQKPEAIAASERIAESFPAGTANPTTVITRADAAQVRAAVENVDGVASVQPGAAGHGVAQLQVTLLAAEGSPQAEQAVVAVRRFARRLRPDLRQWAAGPNDGRHRRVGARPWAHHSADPRGGARRSHSAAASRRGTGAAGPDGGGHLLREPRCVVVDLHQRDGLLRRRRGRAAPGLPVPRSPGRGLQHLPGYPSTRGGSRPRHPGRHAARPGRDRRRDHQRRHPAGRRVRRTGRAPPGRPGPARCRRRPRRPAGHPGRAHNAGSRLALGLGERFWWPRRITVA